MILNELYTHERDEIISELFVSNYIGLQEGVFDGVKAAAGATKSAVQQGKSGINKIGDSNIVNAMKDAISKLLDMMQNILKSLFNGTNKLRKMIKEIEDKESKLSPRQDGKEPKTVKTVTWEEIEKMGLGDGKDSQLRMWIYFFEDMMKDGTIREADFSNTEKSKESLLKIVKGENKLADRNTSNKKDNKLADRLSKLKSIEELSPEQLSEVIKERYGFGYNTRYSNGRSTKELMAKYFKNPKIVPISNKDSVAYTYIKDGLKYIKKIGYALLNLEVDKYLQAELKELQKAQRQIESLNKENIKNAQGDLKKPDEKMSASSSISKSDDANIKGSEVFGGKEDYLEILEAMQAYAEAQDNKDNKSNDSKGSGVGTFSSGGAKIDSSNTEASTTKLGNSGESVKGIFEHLRAFFTSYAIAIHRTMNFYNAFIMNIYTVARRMMNDLSSISVNGNFGG